MADNTVNASLKLDGDDAIIKIAKLRQALQDAKNILAETEKQYKTNSEEAVAQAAKVEQANNDLIAGLKEINTHVSKFESFKTVLSGIQGGITAVSGTLSLFGEKSEIVEQALEKVKIAMDIAEGISSIGKAAEAFKALGIAVSGAGLIAFTAAVTGVIAIVNIFKRSQDEAAEAQKKFNEVSADANKQVFKEKEEIDALIYTAKNYKNLLQDRQGAVDALNSKMGLYTEKITLEDIATGKVNIQIDAYLGQLEKKAKAQAYASKIQEAYSKVIVAETTAISAWDAGAFKEATETDYDFEKRKNNQIAFKRKQLVDEAMKDVKALQDAFHMDLGNKNAEIDTKSAQKQELDDNLKHGLAIIHQDRDLTIARANARQAGGAELNEIEIKYLDKEIDALADHWSKIRTLDQKGAKEDADNLDSLSNQRSILLAQRDGIDLKNHKDNLKANADLDFEAKEQEEIKLVKKFGESEDEIYNIRKHYQQLRIEQLQQHYNEIEKKTSAHAIETQNKLNEAIDRYHKLENDHADEVLDQALVEIGQTIKNFIPPKEVAAKDPAEQQAEKDQVKRDAAKRKADDNDDQVGKDVADKQKEFDAANPKDANESPYKKQLTRLEEFHKKELTLVAAQGLNKDKLEKYYSEAKKKYKKEEADYELGLTANILSQASDLFGKNTVAGKVTAVAAATINTYLAATKALATTPPPFSYIEAAITIATGIKNIQSIINTQVPGQSSGGATVPSVPASPLAPQGQQTNTALNQNQLNQIGNATVRAFVVESDVSNNQEKIARLNRAARLGG